MNAVALFPPVVLFDLDGTLLDSAPDFLATVDAMRARRGMSAFAMQDLRPQVSRGARAMLACAFPGMAQEAREALVPEFLQCYQDALGVHGKPFPGIEDVLAALEAEGTRWGIVTNKPEYLARQLLPLLGWEQRCAVLIGGDTLPARKPDPLPLLHAAGLLHAQVGECVYVGDDARDIEAARAAGMRSVVALWGYRPVGDAPGDWGGDVLVARPGDLLVPAAWP